MQTPPPSAPPEAAPPAPGQPMSQWPPAAKVAVGCGAVAAFLVLLEVVTLALVVSLIFPPEGLQLRVEAPRVVQVGQPFPLTLRVRNDGPTSRLITNVTVNAAAPGTLVVRNPQPRPKGPELSLLGATTWSYRERLAPGETWSVRFEAIARRPGEIRATIQLQADLRPAYAPFVVRAVETRRR